MASSGPPLENSITVVFAYGIKVRTALWMASTESLVLGVLATALGIGGGSDMVWWMTQWVLAETMPDVALNLVILPSTLAFTAVMGILAISLSPVLTIRRMCRLDLPGTLRLVE